jgi:CheY-like chemotaxis protein
MHILYIDDDAEDRDLFSGIIHAIDPSFACSTAIDGQQGLIALEESIIQPDFIFLDINMPVMGGREFLVAIKKIPRLRSIPVVVYTTSAQFREKLEYLGLGAYHVIVKPNATSEALHLISSIIKAKAMVRQ